MSKREFIRQLEKYKIDENVSEDDKFELCKIEAAPLGSCYGPKIFSYTTIPRRLRRALNKFIKKFPGNKVSVYVGSDIYIRGDGFSITHTDDEKTIEGYKSGFFQNSAHTEDYLYQLVAETAIKNLVVESGIYLVVPYDEVSELNYGDVIPFLRMLGMWSWRK